MVIIKHELGHCHLDYDHDSSTTEYLTGVYIPTSLMYPSFSPRDTYTIYENAYNLELFSDNRDKSGFNIVINGLGVDDSIIEEDKIIHPLYKE